MKPRQFKTLANLKAPERRAMLVEGLTAIGENVRGLAADVDRCAEAGAVRAATITDHVMHEEIGKFLILMDIFRAKPNDSSVLGKQLGRVTDHLSKLIYHQIVGYSLGDRSDLVRALEPLRKSHYLDGPLDADWIFRNWLIDRREREMYVDLAEQDGDLVWSEPFASSGPFWGGSTASRLVTGIVDCGLVSEDGFAALEAAWGGFDATTDTRYPEWRERTAAALEAVAPAAGWSEEQRPLVSEIVRHWPMPMGELDISEIKVDLAQLEVERQKILNDQLMSMI